MNMRMKRKRAKCSGLFLLAPVLLLAQTNDTRRVAPVAAEVRGTPIGRPAKPAATNRAGEDAVLKHDLLDAPDTRDGEFIRLGFEKLSAFEYEVFEAPSTNHPGRTSLRSNSVIPPQIRAYDGKRVSVTGFVLPLRLKNRLVSEFLLLRDQGSCCFGKSAQMNHFIRVRLKGQGFQTGSTAPYRVNGILRVGEIYSGDYLSGIYSMDAESVAEPIESRRELLEP